MELKAAKAAMEEDFKRHQLRPGDPGYEYDRQLEFAPPTEKNEWDDSSDEEEEEEEEAQVGRAGEAGRGRVRKGRCRAGRAEGACGMCGRRWFWECW